jgi:hypothetical protein
MKRPSSKGHTLFGASQRIPQLPHGQAGSSSISTGQPVSLQKSKSYQGKVELHPIRLNSHTLSWYNVFSVGICSNCVGAKTPVQTVGVAKWLTMDLLVVWTFAQRAASLPLVIGVECMPPKALLSLAHVQTFPGTKSMQERRGAKRRRVHTIPLSSEGPCLCFEHPGR